MGKKQQPARNTIVVGGKGVRITPSGKRVFYNPAKRKLAAIAVGILMVAVVCLVVLQLSGHSPLTKSKPKAKDVVAQLPVSKPYGEAAKDLNNKLNSATTPEAKSDAYRGIADNESTAGNYSAAYSAAQKAVAAQPTADNYASLALAALQAGDRQAAANAYQKASELAKNTYDRGQSGYDYYQQLKAEVLK